MTRAVRVADDGIRSIYRKDRSFFYDDENVTVESPIRVFHRVDFALLQIYYRIHL